MFNIKNFITDIFKPNKGETFTILVDVPHDAAPDTEAWKERRDMAKQWQEGISKNFPHVKVNPLVSYLRTPEHNSGLPENCLVGSGSNTVSLREVLNDSDCVIAMTQHSATAPLMDLAKECQLRVGSMPTASPIMQDTGLAADYGEIQRRCAVLSGIIKPAIQAVATFSTGHQCLFDMRGSKIQIDDGFLHPEKVGTLSNLPAGEVYFVPNETDNSQTCGDLPMIVRGTSDVVICKVRNNKIIKISGDYKDLAGLEKKHLQNGWRNIAEMAIGLNPNASITGNILQDEKVGFHWAYGLSNHIEGSVYPKHFDIPSAAVHQDVVCAPGCAAICTHLEFVFAGGETKIVIKDGEVISL